MSGFSVCFNAMAPFTQPLPKQILGLSSRGTKLTTHHHVVSRLRMSGVATTLPHASAKCGVKLKTEDNTVGRTSLTQVKHVSVETASPEVCLHISYVNTGTVY